MNILQLHQDDNVAADILIRNGGTAILSETPEICGAEHLLAERAASPEVAQHLIERVEWRQAYATQHGGSLGMGGYGYWDGEQVVRVSDVEKRSSRIHEGGPLFSLLEIFYQGWSVAETKTDLRALLSMNAGSRIVHVRLKMSELLDNIAIGLDTRLQMRVLPAQSD